MADQALPAPRRGYAIASLVLGILSLPTLGLLLIGGMLAIVLGVVGMVKAGREPERFGGRGLAVAGIVLGAASFVVIPFIGIAAAIAIPSLLRARVSANEAAAIADVRGVMAAEARYREANGGSYDTIECLASPRGCIPGRPAPRPIDPRLASRDADHGYHRWFYPGGLVSPPPSGASPTSLDAYAYVAFPASPGRTGIRSFCGDSTGRLCSVRSASELVIVRGACPAACARLD